MTTVARYGAIGRVTSHSQVVKPSAVLLPRSTPLESALRFSGAAIPIVYVALSRGWSLTGNQDAATNGSPMATAPLSVCRNPVSPSPSSRVAAGTPEYVTATTNWSPAGIGAAGVTTS